MPASRRCPRSRVAAVRSSAVAALVATLVVGAGPARADVDFKFGGAITSDIRYRLGAEPIAGTYPNQMELLKNGFSRNENLIKAQLQLRVGEKVKAVGDVDLYLYGFSDVHGIDSLTLRENVDPYRLEVNAAYIDIYKVAPGLDLRIGRQAVVWGAADKFNPTNNLNSLDLSDPLLFGKALANNMVRVDYNPIGDLTLTGVLVPIFRPSQLPRTARVALLDSYRPLSAQDDLLAQNVYFLGATLYKPNTINTFGIVPPPSIDNMQWGLRLAGRILDQDVSLSWYHGRFSLPVPATALFHLDTRTVDAGVTWPRMDVLGADIGGTIAALGGMGYWIEAGVFFPQQVDYSIYSDFAGQNRQEIRIDNSPNPGGSFKMIQVDNAGNYTGPLPACPQYACPRVLLNSNAPFFKMTIGGDWSIGQHVYVNVQYVHGFIDEFGDGWVQRPSRTPQDPDETNIWKQRRIGDYAVAGVDLKLVNDTLLLRLFGVLKMPSLYFDNGAPRFDEYRATGNIFPQIAYQIWDGTEITAGGFIYLGDRSTKFGDPATGASEVFLKAKFVY